MSSGSTTLSMAAGGAHFAGATALALEVSSLKGQLAQLGALAQLMIIRYARSHLEEYFQA